MKHLKLLLFVFCFATASAYGQKRIVFKDLPHYLDHVKETGIDIDKLVIPDREDYYLLGDYLVSNGMYAFYGIVYNSQLISAAQLENKSCWGQFRDLCQSVSATSTGIKVDDISYLKNINFDKDKKTIIFIYSCHNKRTFKRDFKPVLEALKDDPDFDYIMLSADTLSIKSLR